MLKKNLSELPKKNAMGGGNHRRNWKDHRKTYEKKEMVTTPTMRITLMKGGSGLR